MLKRIKWFFVKRHISQQTLVELQAFAKKYYNADLDVFEDKETLIEVARILYLEGKLGYRTEAELEPILV